MSSAGAWEKQASINLVSKIAEGDRRMDRATAKAKEKS
jgi:hypothetical protein